MPAKSDFSAAEWCALRNAPQFVALATAAAGNSGLFGSLSEGMAAAGAFAEATRANNRLIRELLAPEEVRAAHQDLHAALKPVGEPVDVASRLQDAALEAVGAALEALQAHQATDDDSDFRKMLAWLADRVARASKEGDFLGFGGERVSAGERRFLERLHAVVGVPAP